MLGKMKLISEEVRKRPWDIVKKIEKIIREKEKDGVMFEFVNASGLSWKFTFGGISLRIHDINYKSVYKRVKVVFTKDREYEIDLDKIKAKYEEMKKLALKFKDDEERRDKDEERNEKLSLKLKGGVEDIGITGLNNHFTVEIYSLKEEEVKKVIEFIKTLKKE